MAIHCREFPRMRSWQLSSRHPSLSRRRRRRRRGRSHPMMGAITGSSKCCALRDGVDEGPDVPVAQGVPGRSQAEEEAGETPPALKVASCISC